MKMVYLLLATKEFKAACAKQNRGITLFVKREDSLAFSSEERFGRNVTIHPQFKCKKQSERAAKDQAYFTWGSGSDSKITTFQAKPESLSLASPSRIPTHPIFQGNPESALAGHVICWEDSEGSTKWQGTLDKLMPLIATANSKFVGSLNDPDKMKGLHIDGVDDITLMAFWLENVSTLVSTIVDIFFDDDKIVAQHSYVIGKHRLGELVNARTTIRSLEFDGAERGQHTMNLECLPI